MGLGRLKPFCNGLLSAIFVFGSFLAAQNSALHVDEHSNGAVTPAVNPVEDASSIHHPLRGTKNAKADLRIGPGRLARDQSVRIPRIE
jgi:hypothetical protein